MIHKLKTHPEFFEKILKNSKNFEIRKNDRNFKAGDFLILEEYDTEKGYSDRKIYKKVEYVLFSGHPGLKRGYCIMSIKDVFVSDKSLYLFNEMC